LRSGGNVEGRKMDVRKERKIWRKFGKRVEMWHFSLAGILIDGKNLPLRENTKGAEYAKK
jgi:hypothetical protein